MNEKAYELALSVPHQNLTTVDDAFYELMTKMVKDIAEPNLDPNKDEVQWVIHKLTSHSAVVFQRVSKNGRIYPYLVWSSIKDVKNDLGIEIPEHCDPDGSIPYKYGTIREDVFLQCGFHPEHSWICKYDHARDSVYGFMYLLLCKQKKKITSHVKVRLFNFDGDFVKPKNVFLKNIDKHASNVLDFPTITHPKAFGRIITVPVLEEITRNDEQAIIDAKFKAIPILKGTANKLMFGNISNLKGTFSGELYGDVSGLKGFVDNLYGDATGIRFWIKEPLTTPTNIKTLYSRPLSHKFELLTNEDNEKLWNAYRKLAHCTLGLTEDERKLIDYPRKVKPPFDVDVWGRHYVEDGEYMYIYSINPADLMFLKDTNKISSCFCLNSGGNERWDSGMKCLMALNVNNPNFGCVFKIRQGDVKVLRQFKNLRFKWFNPQEGAYFHYDKDGNIKFSAWTMTEPLELTRGSCSGVPKIYGHDGLCLGHMRQKELAYLELYIKDEYTWGAEFTGKKDGENVIVNNHGAVLVNSEFEQLNAAGRITFNKEEILEEAKKIKELVDGIKI